ncbi:FHA domain-containing protein [Clostridium paraputrificum]|uniref:FHA domain-containing protein n=1 Tax=Clostridium paraputrificum TaxID=29363 RepID=UPI003D346F9B
MTEEKILSEVFRDNRKMLQIMCKTIDTVEYQVKMINFNKELPFIEIDVLTMNDNNTLSYDITDYHKLTEAIKKGEISLQVLLDLLLTLVSTLVNLNNYFLNLNNVYLNEENIYFSTFTKEIRVIYLPLREELKNPFTNQKIVILNLLVACKSLGGNNEELDMAIMEVRDDIGTLYSLKNHLEKIKDEEVILKTDEVVQVKPTFKEKLFSGTKNVVKNNIIKKETTKNEETGNKVSIFEVFTLVIFEENNKRIINLDKDAYLLGRLEGAVDIAIKNSSIGRIHGRIEKDDYYYYFIDLNSKNGSFLNGERLISNKKYRLEKGSQIKLANITMYIEDSRGI